MTHLYRYRPYLYQGSCLGICYGMSACLCEGGVRHVTASEYTAGASITAYKLKDPDIFIDDFHLYAA